MFRQRFRPEVRQGTYVLHFARSGEEALDKLAEGIRPSLIVILRHQYAGDGRAGAAARDQERWPAYPVMMVTAYGDDERRRLAGEYGAIEFITKPVDFSHLKVQLQQLAGAAD